ncbi:MFS transporter [Desulfobacter sp.]|uniref:MFS transporter n=1 Tax=Desulfobacter sp. TaxID=2294 RepID=UPI003D1109E5
MHLTRRKTNSFLLEATILLGSTMTVIAGATIAPALPQMATHFQATPYAALLVKMLLSVHALFIAISAPFMGILMDRYGRKPVLIITVALYGIAGSSGFFLDSLYWIIAGRALLGVAVAGIMSGFTTLIGDYFTGTKLNQVMGLQSAFTGFGGMIFVSTAGILTDSGWRYPFLIYLFAFAVLPGVITFLYEPFREKNAAVKPDFDSAKKSVSMQKVFGIYFLAFFGMLVYYMVPVQFPFYMKTAWHFSSTQIGIAIGVLSMTNAISSMQFKKVKLKLSHVQIFILVWLLMGAGCITLALSTGYWMIHLALVIDGCGFGLLMPNVNVWLVSIVPESVRGKFIGGLTTFFLLGQFVSPMVLEPLVKKVGAGSSFLWVGILLIIMAAGFRLIPGQNQKNR